jgi:hypothetical protein
MSQNMCLSFVSKVQVVSFKTLITWKLSTTAAFLSKINYNRCTKKCFHTSPEFRSSSSYVSSSFTRSHYIKLEGRDDALLFSVNISRHLEGCLYLHIQNKRTALFFDCRTMNMQGLPLFETSRTICPTV